MNNSTTTHETQTISVRVTFLRQQDYVTASPAIETQPPLDSVIKAAFAVSSPSDAEEPSQSVVDMLGFVRTVDGIQEPPHMLYLDKRGPTYIVHLSSVDRPRK